MEINEVSLRLSITRCLSSGFTSGENFPKNIRSLSQNIYKAHFLIFNNPALTATTTVLKLINAAPAAGLNNDQIPGSYGNRELSITVETKKVKVMNC